MGHADPLSLDEYLFLYSEVRSLPTAEKAQRRNVKRWFGSHPGAIAPEEQKYIHNDDVVALTADDKSPARAFLEKVAPVATSIFCQPERSEVSNHDMGTYLRDNAALEKFVSFVLVAVGLAILFGPMWWLEYVGDSVKRLAIITGFVAVFTILVHGGTNAQPFEVLGSAAA